MKTKTFASGKYACRTYYKTVGNGFETGFAFGGRTYFVGNFIHAKEATTWYNLMNREIYKFARKYTVGERFPASWFANFVKNHLYKTYYAYLDRLFARYNRDYQRACTRDIRRYQQMKKNYHWDTKKPFFKAA
jgi:hypothetical protein